ncbi:MAG TPA: hypothetical protein VLL76_10620 [Candidatus Omnitrophota bacterium]|nr:hypothetical protein [Candidatus Omnitrophota bacterium]
MAFIPKDLELLAGGAAICLWGYTTNDTAATVDTEGYFNAASHMLKVGDRIHVNADMDGTPAFGLMVVTSNAAGVVDVADLVNLAGTDTD